MDKDIKKNFQKLISGVVERKPPKDSTCNYCDSKDLTIITTLFSGPYSGRIECNKCGKSESLMSYLAKKCFKVEPLSEPTCLKE